MVRRPVCWLVPCSPAVQSSREAARRMQSFKQHETDTVALHNFEATSVFCPNDLGPDKRKTKANLTGAFTCCRSSKKEPFITSSIWMNRGIAHTILNFWTACRRPIAIRSHCTSGYTVYQMARGENMINNPTERHKFQCGPDGLSNTVALLITQDNVAVPWTKPDDIDPIAQRDAICDATGENRGWHGRFCFIAQCRYPG